jgi:hypothetical protein
MLAVAYQLLGLVTCSVWDHPEIGFHTSCPTLVFCPVLLVMSASAYGPQLPLAVDVTHVPLVLLPGGLLAEVAGAPPGDGLLLGVEMVAGPVLILVGEPDDVCDGDGPSLTLGLECLWMGNGDLPIVAILGLAATLATGGAAAVPFAVFAGTTPHPARAAAPNTANETNTNRPRADHAMAPRREPIRPTMPAAPRRLVVGASSSISVPAFPIR